MRLRIPKPSIKSLVLHYLDVHRPAEITERELVVIKHSIRKRLARTKPISRSYLLRILSETTVAIARSLNIPPPDLRRRVHSSSPERARVSLIDLQAEYSRSHVAGNRERAEDCRRAVWQAKDRLKLTLRNTRLPTKKRQEKQEILQWFLVWLETPELFDRWLELRQRKRPWETKTGSEPSR